METATMDVIACGELLIDFVSTQAGVSLAQAPAFKKAPGGAPANVAVGALATTQMGAIPSLPTVAEAKAFLHAADENRTEG